jgi:hypothetical protein
MTDLTGFSVGDQLTSDQMEAIVPARVDRGHVFDGVVYGGAIGGRGFDPDQQVYTGTGLIAPTLDLTVRAGEASGVRAGVANITYAAANGDNVKFLLYRTSAGDKEALLVTLA